MNKSNDNRLDKNPIYKHGGLDVDVTEVGGGRWNDMALKE